MDYKSIRHRALSYVSQNWGLSIGIAAVAALLGGLTTGGSFLPDVENYYELSENLRINWGYSSIFTLAALIIGGVLELGYAQFLLKQHDGQALDFNDLFSQFHRFEAGFVQRFLRDLYCFLWALLLIVPGIIAAFSYALTPFLMADDHNLSPSDAIALSKKMMEGNKWNLFILELTFLGWSILAALTLNLGNLALNPYRNAARAAFYRDVQARYKYQPQNNNPTY